MAKEIIFKVWKVVVGKLKEKKYQKTSAVEPINLTNFRIKKLRITLASDSGSDSASNLYNFKYCSVKIAMESVSSESINYS